MENGFMKTERAFVDIKIAVVVVLLIAAVGYVVFSRASFNVDTSEAPMEQVEYADGVYGAVGNYTSPGGPRNIEVEITLENGVITDASVVPTATDPNSKKKQEEFVASYKGEVIGRDISELALDKISGSSLTPKGFNDALEKVREEARI